MMKLLSIFSLLILISCKQKQKQDQHPANVDSAVVDTVAVLNNTKTNLNIQTYSFTEIDSSGILMFPLSMGEKAREGGSKIYKEIPFNSNWNMIFYNSHTGEHYLLSENKMLIRQADVNNGEDYSERTQTKTDYIFYRVTINDFDKDRKLTSKDPDYLFVSDKAGKNFRQISPSNFSLRNYQFLHSSKKVVMTVTKDSDNNKEFDDKDEILTFEYNILKDSLAREIFPTEFKNKLKLLYGRDWRRIQE